MQKGEKGGARRIGWLVLVAALAVLAGWLFRPELGRLLGREEAQPRAVTARGDLAADEKSTIDLFEHSKDAVVFITTTQRVVEFWSRNAFTIPRGAGSGFLWDEKGHVVTNYHVIAGAAEARVRLSDGKEHVAALVGASPMHDLAVLRIDAKSERAPLPVGSSADLKVGQKVFAIGNPFGLDWTLTTGIVSALDRSLKGDDGAVIEHLIQTDAAINPGNSGGPLLDSAGRLIGVNTAIYSPSGASAGVGFAVPVDTVNRVVPQLIAKGRYLRPALGIEVDQRVNEYAAAHMDVKGVLVLRVRPGSGAQAAGLVAARVNPDGSFTPGDVITHVEGKAVESVQALLSRLDDFRPGDTVRLTLLRDGKEVEAAVMLQAEGAQAG
ncbi:DegP2 peptidase. Serine peptidase. MEROPS family S01B [Humidesulfovibrio mexicanus]|jgi:S1-C subfamily serine protease|uniref:DegP2 peptidase. Serine peptidase. MEROPS family S01B n=1 Tax=Humidesulfovibrio mexicanus TaxID=147047 RepID=A0A238YW46_9BACT|nr:trypsin-like peptidase domain-containing protein [Humidesulfovibrio mexicanus]SNR75357.1 DegP2 peptidase. Serine peptidase. MEROPS family S01B [Humidesulfovibrio mexicanus]